MTNRRIIATLGLLLALLAGSAAEAQQRTLSLNEAIDLSVRNSKALRGSQARIAEAAAAVREALDRRLPDASVSAAYLRLNRPNVKIVSKQSSSGSGGGATQESASPNSAAYGMVNASLPIYAGGRIRYGIESARYLEQAAKLDAEDDRTAIAANTVDAYNNLFKARAAMELVDSSVATARERVRELSNLERNGIIPRNDLLKAQLAQSNAELAQADAQSNWDLANYSMNLMLGLPDSTVLVPDAASVTAPSTLKTIEEYVQDGLRQRSDLQALSLRRQAAATGVKATLAERMPSLALTGGYVALDVPHALTVTNAVNIGLGVKYDIATLWKNKARVEAARAREAEAVAGIDGLNDGIRLQVHQRYIALVNARRKIAVNQQAIAQAEENDRMVRNKFNNQLSTTTELLDADTALLQARLNYALAQNDAAVAYYKLLEATGGLNTTK